MKEISSHDFKDAKNKIQAFSNDLPKNPRFTRVTEDVGPLGMLNHDVSGKELNYFIGEVQSKMIESNETLKKVISEFKVIYQALEALDRDYIDGLKGAVEENKKLGEENQKNANSLEETQKQLSRTVKGLGATVQSLSTVGEKVSAVELLAQKNDKKNKKAFESLTADSKSLRADYNSLQRKYLEVRNKLDDETKNLKDQIKKFESLVKKTQNDLYGKMSCVIEKYEGLGERVKDAQGQYNQLQKLIEIHEMEIKDKFIALTDKLNDSSKKMEQLEYGFEIIQSKNNELQSKLEDDKLELRQGIDELVRSNKRISKVDLILIFCVVVNFILCVYQIILAGN